MTQWRLAGASPGLLAEIESADERGRRVIAATVAHAAAARAGLDNPTITRALAALDERAEGAGGPADAVTREALEALIERLDEEYVGVRERYGAGEVRQAQVANAQERVRAATAVLLALRDDGLEAAAEAGFEAIEAAGNPRPIETEAITALEAYETAGGPELTMRAVRRSQRMSLRSMPAYAGIALVGIAGVLIIDQFLPLPIWLQALVIGVALFGVVGDAANYALCAMRINALQAEMASEPDE